jgi:hypothetical protein
VQALIKKRFWAKGFTVSAEFYSINKNFTASAEFYSIRQSRLEFFGTVRYDFDGNMEKEQKGNGAKWGML